MKKIIGLTVLALSVISGSVVMGGLIENIEMDAGLEIGDFHYRESHFMREDGVQSGVYGSIAILAAQPWYFQFYMSIVGGDVEYDGGYIGGGSLKGDTSNYIFNFRGIVGYMIDEGGVCLMPYSGLGYRFLCNSLDDLPGGYKREQTYVYLPLGLDLSLPIFDNQQWTIGLRSEFDWMFSGFNKSGSTKFTGQDGYGFRFTPYIRYDINDKVGLKLEIFGEYWKIGDSNKKYGRWGGWSMEPENASNYYGGKFGMVF